MNLIKIKIILALSILVVLTYYFNDNREINILKFKAYTGNADAQMHLGAKYLNADGLEKNDSKGFYWTKKSAEQGNIKAQCNLALAYLNGEGTEKSQQQYFYWFKKAAEQGFADAQLEIACAYYDGLGTKKDLNLAIEWVKKAANQNNSRAQSALGVIYEESLEQNIKLALEWHTKAAEQGDIDSQKRLGRIYLLDSHEKNVKKAIFWLEKAGEQGDSYSQGMLGIGYSSKWWGWDRDFPLDYSKAIYWLEKACAQSNPLAQFQMGYLFQSGKGFVKNDRLAFYWYKKAANNGSAQGFDKMYGYYSLGIGTVKDEAEGLAWLYAKNTFFPDSEISKSIRDAEKYLGSQKSILAQKRAKEIVAEIESNKNANNSLEKPDTQSAFNRSVKATGSGVFVAANGYFITAAHVVKTGRSFKVLTSQGTHSASLIKIDSANDVALLKCEGKFDAVPVKESREVKLGESVFTIGFPNVGIQGFSPKMTSGEISSLSGIQDDPKNWQISVPVQQGNSGGALFDLSGNLVGVVVSKLDTAAIARSTGDVIQNVNYAVKSAYVLPLIESYPYEKPSNSSWSPFSKKPEDLVEKVQKSVGLVLVY